MGSARWSLDTEQSLAQICSAYGPIESIYEVLCPLVDMSLMRLRGVWPANVPVSLTELLAAFAPERIQSVPSAVIV